MTRLKKYWQKILSLRESDPEKLSINSARVWIILVVLFFIGLFIVSIGLIILKKQISDRESSIIASSGSVVEKLDEQKLKLILVDYSKRVEEFEKLELTKPSVIDPGT